MKTLSRRITISKDDLLFVDTESAILELRSRILRIDDPFALVGIPNQGAVLKEGRYILELGNFREIDLGGE